MSLHAREEVEDKDEKKKVVNQTKRQFFVLEHRQVWLSIGMARRGRLND